ncbi:MAG: hypothetical protein ACLQJ7_07575 [Syntrophobacteraceae bacterium]
MFLLTADGEFDVEVFEDGSIYFEDESRGQKLWATRGKALTPELRQELFEMCSQLTRTVKTSMDYHGQELEDTRSRCNEFGDLLPCVEPGLAVG